MAARQHKNKKTGSGAFFSTTKNNADAHLNLMNTKGNEYLIIDMSQRIVHFAIINAALKKIKKSWQCT